MKKLMLTLISIALALWLVLCWWVEYEDPYQLLSWWDSIINPLCELQDQKLKEPAPSYCKGELSSNRGIRRLDFLVKVHHREILNEALQLMKDGGAVPMAELDLTQSKFFEWKWRPLWVKFLNGYASSADRMPTLKRIASQVPGLNLLHVSLMLPGTVLDLHRGPSRAVLRYHYGLLIPEGNTGLYLAGKRLGWKEGEGFSWDDTLLHGSWNLTNKPRMVIFADVRRDLGWLYNLGTSLIFWGVSRTRTTTEASHKLEGYLKQHLERPISGQEIMKDSRNGKLPFTKEEGESEVAEWFAKQQDQNSSNARGELESTGQQHQLQRRGERQCGGRRTRTHEGRIYRSWSQDEKGEGDSQEEDPKLLQPAQFHQSTNISRRRNSRNDGLVSRPHSNSGSRRLHNSNSIRW